MFSTVGPGNKFVAEAKRQLFGRCGIDQVSFQLINLQTSNLLFFSGIKTPLRLRDQLRLEYLRMEPPTQKSLPPTW